MENQNFQPNPTKINYRYETKGNDVLDNLKIRAIRVEDAFLINEIRTMEGVFENLPTIYSERITFTHNFITGLSPESDHMLVAEIFSTNYVKIVGVAGLHINRNSRQRHSAAVGIFVHTDYQHKGIGKKLMDKLVEIADKWVLLKRIELEVISDNIPAINFYKKYGFKDEGIKKHCVIKDGEYKDVILMARCT